MILIPAMMGMSIMWKVILLGIVAVSAMGVLEATQGVKGGVGEAPTARVPFRYTPAQRAQRLAESMSMKAERIKK